MRTLAMKASDIRRLLQAVYKPVVADPEFKVRLLRHIAHTKEAKDGLGK